jgi:hypothetical protein
MSEKSALLCTVGSIYGLFARIVKASTGIIGILIYFSEKSDVLCRYFTVYKYKIGLDEGRNVGILHFAEA